jgi:hypothetical protein
MALRTDGDRGRVPLTVATTSGTRIARFASGVMVHRSQARALKNRASLAAGSRRNRHMAAGESIAQSGDRTRPSVPAAAWRA